MYLSNRTNYKALAEIGCKTNGENGDQSFLHSSVYSSLSQAEGSEYTNYMSTGLINKVFGDVAEIILNDVLNRIGFS